MSAIPPVLCLPPDARLVGVFVNGVPQHPGRDFDMEGRHIRLRRPVTPRVPVGRFGNLLTALCATVLPAGDEIDVVVDTPSGRRVLDLSRTAEADSPA